MIAASLGLKEAGDRIWDAVVVGAGPAGALAAREVARRGAAVLLVDRAAFPRYKVCGCCLNRRALATLAAVGLEKLASELGGVPLARFHLAAWGKQAVVPLPGGVSLSRTAFDAALVEAAVAAGAAFLPETQANLGATTPETRRLALRQHGEEMPVAARLVLAADGLGARFLAGDGAFTAEVAGDSHIGCGVVADVEQPFYEDGTIFMACAGGGYVGLVRLGDGRLNMAAAFAPARVRECGGLGKAAAAILTDAGLPTVPGLAALPWRGTPLLTRRAHRPAGHRAFLLGDAAGYVEPFTGEGMAWALHSGASAGPLAVHASREWNGLYQTRWASRHRNSVVRRQRVCRVVAQVLRRPSLMRSIVSVLARVPALASPLIRYLNAWQVSPPRSGYQIRMGAAP